MQLTIGKKLAAGILTIVGLQVICSTTALWDFNTAHSTVKHINHVDSAAAKHAHQIEIEIAESSVALLRYATVQDSPANEGYLTRAKSTKERIDHAYASLCEVPVEGTESLLRTL